MASESRPTVRCVLEDLRLPLPPAEANLAELDDDLMDELRRLAPSAPAGQKRILSIEHPLVYRVRHGRRRGATWVDEESDVFWLLASEERAEGSGDDAYEYFRRLHEAGRLLPTVDDARRREAERAARWIRQAQSSVQTLSLSIRSAGGATIEELAEAGSLEIRVKATGTDPQEVWIAIAARGAEAARQRDVVFALFEAALDPLDWNYVTSFVGEPLARFDVVARLLLR